MQQSRVLSELGNKAIGKKAEVPHNAHRARNSHHRLKVRNNNTIAQETARHCFNKDATTAKAKTATFNEEIIRGYNKDDHLPMTVQDPLRHQQQQRLCYIGTPGFSTQFQEL